MRFSLIPEYELHGSKPKLSLLLQLPRCLHSGFQYMFVRGRKEREKGGKEERKGPAVSDMISKVDKSDLDRKMKDYCAKPET